MDPFRRKQLHQIVKKRKQSRGFVRRPRLPGIPGYTPIKGVDYFDGAPGMSMRFRFYGGRLQSWDLAGRQTIWVNESQRFKVNDETGEVKVE